jgi:hypothetical protein
VADTIFTLLPLTDSRWACSLDHLLETEDCDVDLQTRLDASTPLHLAVQVSDPELRLYLVRVLLEGTSLISSPRRT